MTLLFVIERTPIYLLDNGCLQWTGKAAVDVDGIGPAHGDPCYQPDTSLYYEHKPLNADVDKYIVVPPLVIQAVKAVVLGCFAEVKYKGHTTAAVVGDIGPRRKIGEMSRACAQALGIPDSPVSGGVDAGVEYTIRPGTPAVVDGKTYSLQPS